MCLITFAWKASPQYKLLLAANRDEYINRPTSVAEFDGDILAGKDLQAGGTWMGVTRSGRFAAVTNYRSTDISLVNAKTRGALVSEFLSADCSAVEYLLQLEGQRECYNPFNLLVHDGGELLCYNSITNSIEELHAGVYALSNHSLDSDWPKQNRSRAALNKLLTDKTTIDAEQLLTIMLDNKQSVDSDLPATGISLEWERRLSSILIEGEEYATRSTSVLMLDYQQKCQFVEQTYTPQGKAEISCNQLFTLVDV